MTKFSKVKKFARVLKIGLAGHDDETPSKPEIKKYAKHLVMIFLKWASNLLEICRLILRVNIYGITRFYELRSGTVIRNRHQELSGTVSLTNRRTKSHFYLIIFIQKLIWRVSNRVVEWNFANRRLRIRS